MVSQEKGTGTRCTTGKKPYWMTGMNRTPSKNTESPTSGLWKGSLEQGGMNMAKKWTTRTVSTAYQGRPMREAERMSLRERHRRHRLAHPNDLTMEVKQ